MALVVLKCPNCGAPAPGSVAGSVATCEFCGAALSGAALQAPAPAVPARSPRSAPTVTAVADLNEASLLSLARRRLGSVDSLYFDGSVPPKKLAAARETHGEAIGRVLAQYDDTLFGGADDGFVVTATTLYWKNIGDEPRSLRWADIDPASVRADEEGAHIGGHCIQIILGEGKPMIEGLARLIADAARWARGEGAPSD